MAHRLLPGHHPITIITLGLGARRQHRLLILYPRAQDSHQEVVHTGMGDPEALAALEGTTEGRMEALVGLEDTMEDREDREDRDIMAALGEGRQADGGVGESDMHDHNT